MGAYLRRIWRRFLTWLRKPIEFPGKWDVNEPPRKSYNRESHRNDFQSRR